MLSFVNNLKEVTLKEDYHYSWNESTYELTQSVKINGKFVEVGVLYGVTPEDLEKLEFLVQKEIAFWSYKKEKSTMKVGNVGFEVPPIRFYNEGRVGVTPDPEVGYALRTTGSTNPC